MLELQNVNKFYTNNGVTNIGLRAINLKFNLGELVAITGDSGSGKSTLLNVIAKLDTFDEGEIYYKGNETGYFSIKDMDDFRKNKVGFIFQNYNIIDSYTVLENVMVPLLLKGMTKAEAKQKAKILIEKVGLKDKIKNRGTKLSGGEKQRCVIARALASDCEILICDEPTGNLDSKTTKEIVNLIKEVSKDKLVLIVTHNFEDFQDIVTRKIVMEDGAVIDDIHYKDFPDDQDINLNLDYVPLQKKIKFKIATNNIFFTPKRSLFILIIFLCISLFNLYLFSEINQNYNSLSYINNYKNQQDNRVYIYNKNNLPLDVEKITKICDKTTLNAFYEDRTLYIKDNETELCRAYYNNYIDNYQIVKGNLPQNDKEIFIVFPESMLDEHYYGYDRIIESLNKIVTISSYDEEGYIDPQINDITACKITGYGINKKIDNCIIFGNEKLETTIKNKLMDFDIKVSYTTPWINYSTKVTPVTIDNKENKTSFKIYIPQTYEIEKCQIDFTLNEIYQITDYELCYHEDGTQIVKCEYYPKTFNKNQIFEISAYDKNPESLKRKIDKLGYNCDIVKTFNQSLKLEAFFLNISKYLAIIASSSYLIIIFFITYFLLSRVYNSKKTDYQILRTLGITKKDMSKIVTYEVLMIALTSWILGIIIFGFISSGEIFNQLGIIIIYLIVSFIFALTISRRFNHRLFKFSVSKSLKGGEDYD